MGEPTKKILIPVISNDGRGVSNFTTRFIDLQGDSERMLSDQQAAVNFRLRSSDTSYASDWHVAGDPTLLVVLAGIVRIILRNDDYKDFSAGEMFIAEDFLLDSVIFDNTLHGHRAEVVSDNDLSVLHLKLARRISI